MSTSPPSAGTPSVVDLCRPYACCHSLCEFRCVSVPLCLGFVSLGSPIPTGYLCTSFSIEFPESCGKEFDGDILSRTVSRCLTPCTLSICGFYMCSPLLREEASLMMAEQGTDLWVWQKFVRSHFIALFFYQSISIWLAPSLCQQRLWKKVMQRLHVLLRFSPVCSRLWH